jgi:hypothetical protein
MDVPIRIRPNPFIKQPERVIERIQWEETPRLGVSEGIRLRIGPVLSSDDLKGLWKGNYDEIESFRNDKNIQDSPFLG